MSSLLLVNPSHRKSRKPRTAAQKAATRRLVALNRSRRSAPRRAKRRSNPIAANPVHRRRPRRAASVAHHVRRRRRNPIGGMSGPFALIMPAFKGAAGALVVNGLFNYLPLPTVLNDPTGKIKYLTKGALAILLGTFGKKIIGQTAVQMAEGSLTVTLAGLMQDLTSGMGINLGASDGIAYYSPGLTFPNAQLSGAAELRRAAAMHGYPETRVGEYVPSGMGEYMRG